MLKAKMRGRHHHELRLKDEKSMLWRCCWIKKGIQHELSSILMKESTHSNQNHPLGWGGGGEVSNSIGYRAEDSWKAEENGNIP